MKPPTRRILIVDDSPEDRAEMRRMLLAGSETRYRFTEAELGSEGLRLCREAGDGMPDAVLLDFSLPDMNAEDLLLELRQGGDLPPCPVVVITGTDKPSGPELLRAGAQDFLGKSWTTPESLTRAVENSIERFALLTERKRAEEKIARQVRELDALYATAPTGLFQFDANLRFVRVNGWMATINGRSVEAHIGRTVSEVLDPEAACQVERLLRRVMQTGEPVLGIEVRGATAASVEERHWLASYYPLPSPDGEVVGVYGVVMDVTTRKQAEDARRESQQFTRSVLENLFAFVGVMTVDGTLTYANRAPVETAGIPASEVLGQKFWDCHWWNYSPEIQARLREACERAASGEIVRYDVPVRMAGDTRVWIDFQIAPLRDSEGRITHLIPTAMDIGVRRAAEEKLRASEAKFRQIADTMPQIAWAARPDGYTDYYNERWYEFTGFSRHEFGQPSWEPILHPDDVQRCLDTYFACIRSGTPYRFEHRFKDRASGGYRWFMGQALPVRDERGEITRWFGTYTDIDAQKRAEEKLEATVTERTAKLQETVSELESYSYSISHDLRAPLRGIQSFAQILEEECRDEIGRQGREYIRRIVTAADRMDRLIQDVLVYSRVARTDIALENVDLVALLKGILEGYPQFQLPKAEITVSFPLPPVRGNVAALTQCLSNLVGNAVKFVPPGVVPHVKISAVTRDKRVRLSIQDNGIGIDPKMHGKIFAIFNRLSRDYEGTGIGLAVVRRAAERMGGAILVESELGKGSTFHLELNGASWE